MAFAFNFSNVTHFSESLFSATGKVKKKKRVIATYNHEIKTSNCEGKNVITEIKRHIFLFHFLFCSRNKKTDLQEVTGN